MRVAITGGSGTLAKAILTKAKKENWSHEFTLIARNEFRLAQMRGKFPEHRYAIGDIRDYERLLQVFPGHDAVLHAGALKRIPECDEQPLECVETNIIGTVNVMRACLNSGIKQCVGISTDKACRAITNYGASKKVLESLFSATPVDGTCKFTTVRYGNVVQSNGSVIPIWRNQVKQGLPITVTDASMTRFWMSPFDAVDVVMKALGIPHGSIYVPKLGALSIGELAKIIAPDSEIKAIGVRSVEKSHEDLIHVDEKSEDCGNYYLVTSAGKLGNKYSSDIAPRLTKMQFLEMLDEAESLE